MVNIIDLKREINHILGEKSTDYFKLLTLYFSGRIEKGTGCNFSRSVALIGVDHL